jgi:uncharacterized protein (DUF1015 family)
MYLDGSWYRLEAKENLEAFRQRGLLFQEEKPCYYIYALTMEGHTQTGLVAVSSVRDYQDGVIKKHEFTRPEKELDRIRHISTTGAQSGNVFLAYHALPEMDALIADQQKKEAPVYDFTTDDAVTHKVWVIRDEAVIGRITRIFAEQVPATYIADGHHRAASAAKVAAEGDGASADSSTFFLTTLFPDNQLRILDYNRVVRDLNGLSGEAFLEKLAADFQVTETGKEEVKPAKAHVFGMYLDGSWYRLEAKEGTFATDPISILDVSILQNNVLDKWLGIKDPRTDKRIDFVGGIRGMKALAKRVDSGEMKVAFSVYPVTMAQLFAIADSGRVMPPKSTWFEPKLRDGLLTHLIR